MKLLNIGCGNSYHADWVNIDLNPPSTSVIDHDVKSGLPFESNYFDFVYHSHVLEHLSLSDGANFLKECFRVLKPSGTIRVVVPDLEGIVRSYVTMLENGLMKESKSEADQLLDETKHRWAVLEMIDQVGRERSGGDMAPFMRQSQGELRNLIRQRLGADGATFSSTDTVIRQPFFGRIVGKNPLQILRALRQKTIAVVVRVLGGKSASNALAIGQFRVSGECHRWMYDHFSLAHSLKNVGFENSIKRTAVESRWDSFSTYKLDATEGVSRKPDSLYMEAMKPEGIAQ